MLEPLTCLTKDGELQAQRYEQIKAFEDSKRAVGESTLLTHPQPDREFILYPDASNYQVGAQLIQCGLTIGLDSSKLTNTQKRCPTMCKELLAADKGT